MTPKEAIELLRQHADDLRPYEVDWVKALIAEEDGRAARMLCELAREVAG